MQYCDSCGSCFCDCPSFLKSSHSIIEERFNREKKEEIDHVFEEMQREKKLRQEMDYSQWRMHEERLRMMPPPAFLGL